MAFGIVRSKKTQRDSALDDPPGIDLAGVMARLDGNLPLLDRLLPQFIDASRSRDAALKVALKAGNLADAAALLHQMRGSAASVGAIGIAELAGRAEMVLKQDGVAALADFPRAFDTALRQVRRGAEIIAARVAAGAEKSGGDVGGAQIAALLDFLKTNNLRALDVIRDCETFLVHKLGREQAGAVLSAVEGLDFAEAHEKLAGLLPSGAVR